MTSAPLIDLSDGVQMPALALGTFRLPDGAAGITPIHQAIEVGFRHLDAATFYGNEAMVGEALATAPAARSDLFVTTKVWPTDQGYQATLEACRASLEALRLDYIDCYMLHWPVDDLLAETWRAMEQLVDEGLVRAAGVSNFAPRHFEMLEELGGPRATVNQIEMNPFCFDTQRERVAATRRYGAVVAGYRPFANGAHFEHPLLLEIGGRHGMSVAQVLLRWQLDHGFACIPGWAPAPDLMAENLAASDFKLTWAEIAAIDGLDEALLTAAVPPEATP